MLKKCVRRLQFCAGHRVMGHENKCSNVHGHNYVAFIEAEGGLDEVGRVVDFSCIKQRVGGWIDQYWDHGMILAEGDVELIELMRGVGGVACSAGQKLYVMTNNPTAENMAEHLLLIARGLVTDLPIEITKVVIWETENCYAEAH